MQTPFNNGRGLRDGANPIFTRDMLNIAVLLIAFAGIVALAGAMLNQTKPSMPTRTEATMVEAIDYRDAEPLYGFQWHDAVNLDDDAPAESGIIMVPIGCQPGDTITFQTQWGPVEMMLTN